LKQSLHIGLQTTAVTILASRGIFSLIILMLPNYAEIRDSVYATIIASDRLVENIVKEEATQNPHLNTALRAEILYFTTQVFQYKYYIYLFDLLLT
jgi:hypothetical protein